MCQQNLRISEVLSEICGETRLIVSVIQMNLEIKFGNEELQLMSQMSQFSQFTDLEQLKLIQRRVKTANNLEELRGLIKSI